VEGGDRDAEEDQIAHSNAEAEGTDEDVRGSRVEEAASGEEQDEETLVLRRCGQHHDNQGYNGRPTLLYITYDYIKLSHYRVLVVFLLS